ncbi:hypothetical protein AB0G79_28275 [Streptomyces sp. NPDC020807]|uniref:hypothetical protein n=1 Tax=Streptomyces sp. NPDC020807 TaxID=3155119 RepID=UPI0033F406F3
MTNICYVLDSEGLSRAAARDRLTHARLDRAHQGGARVMTSSMTLIEAHHDKIPMASWKWMLSRVVVVPVTEDVANDAIELLRSTGLHGHKYAIDAALAVIAGRERGHVTVFTSDVDDMTKLCPPHVRIQPV